MIEIPGYRVLRQLGRGGMATVYLAVQESIDREVALKVMSPALLVDPTFGERFLREAQIAARLHHRHVVGVHDLGRAGDYHYIAMEYVGKGPILSKDGTARDVAFALRVTREIARALNYANEKGFVHRDIKPDNILLREDGSSVLTDFGIARAYDLSMRMTKTGAIVGTPHYMSPEQARGRQLDGRSDLYALGVVLYEMLVGRVPYHADDSLAIGIMHITEPVPALSERLAPLQPLIDRMLAKQPEDRYQSGNEVASAIEAIEQRMRTGELAGLDGEPDNVMRAIRPGHSRHASERAVSPMPPRSPAMAASVGAQSRDRMEPNLGRLDDFVNAVSDDVMRADRAAKSKSHLRASGSRRVVVGAAAFVLLAGVLGAAWHYQDRLRHLLPRTEFNDTLSRAQHALDAGRLTGNQGDSARELFLAARAQDQDNDIARRGLQNVGHQLVARADEALAKNDPVAARTALETARELLGGGIEVDRTERALKDLEARGSETGQLLEQAHDALAAGRVVGADGAAALYQRVLVADKTNALAQSGLGKSADALATQARAALDANDADTASARTDDITRILPAYSALPGLLGRIAQVREGSRIAREETVTRAEAQIRAGRLTGSPDSALELFRAVLNDDPSNARAKEGVRRIAQALIIQATAAIDDDNAGMANRLLESAAELSPEAPELRAARSNLRELRERLDIDAEHAAISPGQVVQMQKLVADAATAAAAGHLILPPGDSAYDKYRAALAIDGNNRDALDGLARLPGRAKDLFAQALNDGAPQRARALLDSVRQVAPEDAAIPAMTLKLANAFIDQTDARIGEGRREDATRALDAARQLSPDNPRIAPLDARLKAIADGQG
ncbi:MAG: protein kinase [Dokdonella sp.]|uniref:serine/threonine-protein kinase n=1 Tax=Dokdonella sp. TaxID=2291710 RepID=UPI00326341F8